MFKLDLEKAEEPEIKLPTSYDIWIIEKAREFQKNIYFCFIDYAKVFDCVYLNNSEKFQMFKLDSEKAEEQEIILPTSIESQKRQENSRKTSTSASLTILKPLTVWITTNWKILQEMEIKSNLPPEKSVCRPRSNS